ncbi:unnamed protein product [Arctia plantaginis]|uniref:Uncharacterized protein n=1 Tax=Arctia plantaginis TaxID=874455 RepID=A0A8S1A517_ARCPL|nr:unnamed protein product [Arctia plantaginis]
MVKLPDPSEELVRAGAEQRSPYSWRYPRNRRQRTAYDTEPKGLIELDRLAVKAVKLMEKYCPESEANYYKVMDLLRLQYNLYHNFEVLAMVTLPRNRRPRREPEGWTKLNRLTEKTVQSMQRQGAWPSYRRAMDLVRLRYNLNFIVVCEYCGALHEVDELAAPER